MDEFKKINDNLVAIRQQLQEKQTEVINLKSRSSVLNVTLTKPIQSKDVIYLGLKAIFTYYNIPNISNENNVFAFEFNGDTHEILIPEGAYDFEDIETEINNQLKNRYFYTTNEVNATSPDTSAPTFKITGDIATCKSKIEIPKGFKVDFTKPQSLGKMLGFNSQILLEGIRTSEHLVDINPVNSITVCCNIVDGEIDNNGNYSDGIYTFFPTELPGEKINREVENVQFFPLRHNDIRSLRIELKDDAGNVINNRGEKINVVLLIRS